MSLLLPDPRSPLANLKYAPCRKKSPELTQSDCYLNHTDNFAYEFKAPEHGSRASSTCRKTLADVQV